MIRISAAYGAASLHVRKSVHTRQSNVQARVLALQGGEERAGGMQAACSYAVFDQLRADFGVRSCSFTPPWKPRRTVPPQPRSLTALQTCFCKTQVSMELFASPLNARFDRFCSAAADVDAAFGSVGSFFSPSVDALFESGAFHANPPYDAACVSRLLCRLEELLGRAARSMRRLTFVVVIPYWPDKPCWQALAAATYTTAKVRVPQGEHGFFEGAQQHRPSLWRPANHDTSVFFLQSPAAAAALPLSAAKEQRLLRAFRTPPPACELPTRGV